MNFSKWIKIEKKFEKKKIFFSRWKNEKNLQNKIEKSVCVQYPGVTKKCKRKLY